MIVRTLRFFSSGALYSRAWRSVVVSSVCLVSLLRAASESPESATSYAFFERMDASAARLMNVVDAGALRADDYIFAPTESLWAGVETLEETELAEPAVEVAEPDTEEIKNSTEAVTEAAVTEELELQSEQAVPELLESEDRSEAVPGPVAGVESLMEGQIQGDAPASVELGLSPEPVHESHTSSSSADHHAAAVAPQDHSVAESEPSPVAGVGTLLEGLLQGLESETPASVEVAPSPGSGHATHVSLSSTDAHESATDQPGAAVAPVDPATLLTPEERYMQRALSLYHSLDFQQAIPAFVAVLNLSELSEATEKRAMIYLARIYYQTEVYVRCVSILQQYIKRFPNTEDKGEITFQTGLLYREIGLHDTAITTFYSVLNSIIVSGDTDMDRYMELARRAQFEIARTYFEMQEWELALNLFKRIELFELSAADRETLAYYKIKSLLVLGERAIGLSEIESFLRLYPGSDFISELLYEKAKAQSEMKQQEAGRRTMLKLMERGGLPQENVTEEWVRWRRSAGNFLSNFYYKRGAYATALRLYQGIVVLDSAPYWQLPVILQMAYCFDKLGQLERAKESFQYVVQEVQRYRASNPSSPLLPQLDSLEERAQWWLDMVNWRADFDAQRLELIPED